MGSAGPIPPSPPTAVAAPAATPSVAQVLLGEGLVAKLPERLQDLPRTVVLTGTVAGSTPEGLTRIRTQMGEVLLDLAATLSTDKPVTVQIAAGQPPGRAMVFANAPPTAGQAGAAPPQPPPSAGTPPAVLVTLPTTAPAMPGAAVPLLLPGSILPALVLAAAKPATPPGPGPGPGPGAPPASRPAPATPAPSMPTAAAPSSAAPTAPTSATPTPGATAQPTAAPPPSGPPPDVPVQLGGDAAHPGASPALPSGAKPETKPEAKPDPTATPKAAPQNTAQAEAKNTPQPTPQALPKAVPQTTPPAIPQTAPPAAPQPTAEAAPQPQPPAAPAKPVPMLVQGATVALKVVSVAQPGAAAPIPLEAPLTGRAPAESEGPLLHGTVAGATPQGQPILATRQGMLVLTTQGPLPPGTRVTVVLTDPVRAQHAAAPHGVEAPADVKDWPALRQVMAALAASDPELARTLANTILPQPNKKLAAALTFLLSAMRGGDARGWLGEEAVATLERTGQTALLKQMEEELRAPHRPADAAPADWKLFAVPMLDGHALQAMQVQIRRVDGDEGGGAAGEREARGSRFVIDLELSRFGPLQLDGLVRPQRFDLILRTHTPFPAELNAELTGVFADSLGAVGFTGTLSFQNGARNWVKLTRAGRAGLGVTA